MRSTPSVLLFVSLLGGSALAASPSIDEKSQILHFVTRGSRPELERAITDFVKLGKPRDTLKRLARLLAEGDRQARENAGYFFATLAEPGAEGELIRALADEDPIVRDRCATALGKLKSRAAVAALTGLTVDLSPVVRREAAKALGHIGDVSAAPKIVELLKDPIVETKVAAILALGELKDRSAEKSLLPLLKDPSETVRLAAARSLCALGNAEARKRVEGFLSSKEPTERRDGIRLVEDVRLPWVRDALLGLTKDKEIPVAIAAAKALALQGDGRGIEWLVHSASRVSPEDTLKIETVLEDLHLASADRKKILEQKPSAGLVLPAVEKTW